MTTEDSAETSPLERALKRERAARKQAEKLLEDRSLELYHSKKAVEDAYLATIEVFASLVGGRSGRTPESLRRLGRTAKTIAKTLDLDEKQQNDIYLAGMLCDLGKLVLPDDLTSKPVIELTKTEREVFQTHPQLAYDAIIALAPLEAVATTLLEHCELYDGTGYPMGTAAEHTSQSARILSVTKDFDALQRGVLLAGELTESEALQYLESNKGKRYDPAVVEAFKTHLENTENDKNKGAEERLTPTSLREGMTLTRDLLNDNDVLILSAGRILDKTIIEKLRKISKARTTEILVYVEYVEKDDEDCDEEVGK